MVSAATDTRERVDVAASPEPAAANEDTPKVLTLKQRMAAIADECAGFAKDNIRMDKKDGGTFTIKGHTFEAILSEVRPLLHKHGVDIEPNLAERTYTGNRCDVLVDFKFERTDDSEEFRIVRWGGAGTDNGDKAFAKAGTNCLKEMLKKRFRITDREDAKESEEAIEHQTEGQASRAALDGANERGRAALEKWAKAARSAFQSAASLDDVKALEREHKDQLMDPVLPEVTRAFFIDLIQSQKAKFAEPAARTSRSHRGQGVLPQGSTRLARGQDHRPRESP